VKVEFLRQLGEVVCVSVHVVPLPRLAGTAVPTPVMGDAAKATRSQEKHLVFKGVAGQGPSMAKDDRLP
jgi:hypothetical protein